MNERLLVDECLTPELVPIACEFGFEAYHVVHIGLGGEPDRVVFRTVMDDGFLFVTNDREDWNALVSRVDLHAGLLVIRPRCRREVQKKLFRAALARVQAIGGLMNKVLEIDEAAEIAIFDLPRPVAPWPVEEEIAPLSGKPAASGAPPRQGSACSSRRRIPAQAEIGTAGIAGCCYSAGMTGALFPPAVPGKPTQPACFMVKIVPAAFVAHRMVAVTFRHPYDTRPETPAFGDAAPFGNPRGQLHSPFKSM